METSVLKAFAGDARRLLLSEVRARLELVLAEGSTQRREFEPVIAKLESAIGDAGGGETGRVAVVDRVAYTWFNRIIALRFMDANSYTGIGVVSPSVDRPDGQPEVLVDAKRGEFDADVVAPADAQRITGLLNGSVTSSDPESEAFGLLLAAYCRFWNKSMPFMFEQDSDYTELLMPSDLLSDESVIARAVTVLNPEMCADVEVIGWLYQFYIAERKDEVFAGFKKGKKAGAAEIPAATQLFTPDWIVRYLVENTLGRLWMLNRPDSSLGDRMDYYIAPVDQETDFLKVEGPEDIKVMDPACGSGHMLTYAFDLLYAMYEEDGYNPADIPSLILLRNLYGTEIDARAGALAAFALSMKARARQSSFFSKKVIPNTRVLERVAFTPNELEQLVDRDGDRDAEEAFFTMFTDADTLGALIRPDEVLLPAIKARVEALDDDGSLFSQDLTARASRVVDQAECLTSHYHVVVANPPYMGNKNMTPALSEWAKHNYPETKTDLFAMFVERNLALGLKNSQLGFMTPFVWMFISSYAQLRQELLSQNAVTSLIQLEYSGFEGATVPVCAFTIVRTPIRNMRGGYIRLSDFKGAANQSPRALQAIRDHECGWFYWARSCDFENVPGVPLVYWLAGAALSAFASFGRVGDVAELKAGISTGDNTRFQRYWFEVSKSSIRFAQTDSGAGPWVPCNSGGSFRRWYGNNDIVMFWDQDGREIAEHPSSALRNLDYMGRPGLTYSKVSSGAFAARLREAGFNFDDTGRSIFGADVNTETRLLGFLNSAVAHYYLTALTPTLSFTSAEIGNVPFLNEENPEIVALVGLAVDIAKRDWDAKERSWNYEASPLVLAGTSAAGESSALAARFDGLVGRGAQVVEELKTVEEKINEIFITGMGLADVVSPVVEQDRLSLDCNPLFRRGSAGGRELESNVRSEAVEDLVSYAVGCMFGRYSLDKPGLILANQGDTLQDYLAQIPEPSFLLDEDNVIPVLPDDWFDDDIVERFRLYLRVAFGEENFEENLRFVEESLGKNIRKYFLTDFYKDHVQRYKKRPIYWMFSSPKGTFNALIYMHRYNPSTVSTVLNEYLREFQAKLEAELNNQGRIAADPSTPTRDKARAEKESDKLRKMIAELKDYEHDVLYPLASQQISIDLDDGVKANYPKFGTALKKIPGLEAAND